MKRPNPMIRCGRMEGPVVMDGVYTQALNYFGTYEKRTAFPKITEEQQKRILYNLYYGMEAIPLLNFDSDAEADDDCGHRTYSE